MKRKLIVIGFLAAMLISIMFAANIVHAQQPSTNSALLGIAAKLSVLHSPLMLLGLPCSSSIYGYSPQLPSWYCPINAQIYATWQGYLPLAMLAVVLSFGIAALIFMSGVLTRSTRIREFGIGELYEAIASALIVILFMFVSGVLFGLLPQFVVGTINPYATAFNLITQTLGQARQLYNSIYTIYFADASYVTMKVNLAFPVTGISTDLFLPIFTLPIDLFVLQPAEAIASFLVDGMLVLYGEYYLLVFFAISSIPVFLVPGVIFRAIFPTRALGGMLIAIAIAFYLVMPTLFAVAFYFVAPSALTGFASASSSLNQYAANGGSVSNGASQSSPIAQELTNIGPEISGFWLMILFFPMLIIAVTYAFIVQIANFIGGASRTSGRLRSFI